MNCKECPHSFGSGQCQKCDSYLEKRINQLDEIYDMQHYFKSKQGKYNLLLKGKNKNGR